MNEAMRPSDKTWTGLIRSIGIGVLVGAILVGLDGLILGAILAALLGDPEPLTVILWLGLCFALPGAMLGGLVAAIGWACRRRLILHPVDDSAQVCNTSLKR
jgi:hypothetical protein